MSPALKPGTEPSGDQVSVPIRWLVYLPETTTSLILPVFDAELEPAFGAGRSRKIKSFGHDEDGVHWLVTRAGTPYHTDPAYARYTHHLIVRNDGWRTRGFSDQLHPPMTPGAVYCLDTHSPHHVVRDDRLPFVEPGYKVQVAVDRNHPLTPREAIDLLAPWVGLSPRESAASATLTAPRYRPPS